MKYLIAYHLNNPADYEFEDIPQALYRFAKSATNCFDNLWLIETSASSAEIKEQLSKYLGVGDQLLVSPADATEFADFAEHRTAWMLGNIDA